MTRKDYVLLAYHISFIVDVEQRKTAAIVVADAYKSDNGRFDRDKFYAACSVDV